MLERIGVIFLLQLCFAGSSSAGVSYESLILRDDPVLWWRFDYQRSVDGSVAYDEISNYNSYYDGNTSIVTGGIDGGCGWFNGNLAGVELGSELRSRLDASKAITVEAWLRCADLPASGARPIFATRINAAYAGMEVIIVNAGGSCRIQVGARSTLSDSYQTAYAPFDSLGQWNHLVCVSDFANGKVIIYLNGQEVTETSVQFGSRLYEVGAAVTQTDQIARDCSLNNFYRGWLDEVAVYNRALNSFEVLEHYRAAIAEEPACLWVSQAFSASTYKDVFYGSPSLAILPDGTMIASHDYFGDGVALWDPTERWRTAISKSVDGGNNWVELAVVNRIYWASLFEHNGDIYLLGVNKPSGSIVISKSSDEGLTWSLAYNNNTGLLFSGGFDQTPPNYTTGSATILKHNGRVYRSFEDRVYNSQTIGQFKALVVSADLNSDLLNSSNWTMSNKVEYNLADTPPEWGATLPCWLEGSMTVDTDGQLWLVERFNSYPTTDKAALLKLSSDGTVLEWDVNAPDAGFIDMPGGMHMFTTRYDSQIGLHLALVNNNTDSSGDKPQQRNTLSLVSSENLIHWRHIATILQDDSLLSWEDSVALAGFQYVEWLFDGDDIVFVSRTAYDGAMSYHDSNRITFHRIENYQRLFTNCGNWGYDPMDFNFDCIVNLKDFFEFDSHWLN
ncbi:hypothetical protein SMSP2_01340 [Limihaloglobus sulfuriphilus]|uniref:LamG-like jellyroll fold domain-containing protein n=1 Tax=Limihaloglobus sulfuriphilus TaxID=1851148 RepID=A0A1Q2ME48_9BACT|nr:LamG-like jellyroll fold domain-containing protein [Limihaloglobus sulfuriphilus]AQQ70976.1 hypothetical protein SMSP2_01340 [Limihaloglobus sulfuriphilus]